jgi:uncharacterized SAM-binding protein YcdF (DUF218 family)
VDLIARIVSLAIDPLPWLLLALLAAVLSIDNGRRGAKGIGLLAVVILWAGGSRGVADLLISRFENRHPVPALAELRARNVGTVVVLTGGGYDSKREQRSSVLPHGSMYRFVGGLELAASLGPGCRIIFSGSAGRSARDLGVAGVMEELARRFEPGREVLSESRSGSTAEHPANVKPLIGGRPFALVTSAYHMPRAVASFRRAGLDPVPYPVDFLSSATGRWTDWVPTAEVWWRLGVVLRETVATGLYSLRRW